MPESYYKALKVMLGPFDEAAYPPFAHPVYSPFGWYAIVYLDTENQDWSSGPHGDTGSLITTIYYDPYGYFTGSILQSGGSRGHYVKGHSYNPADFRSDGYDGPGAIYFATDAEILAALSVTFGTETIPRDYPLPSGLASGPPLSRLNRYVPAGTATSYDEQLFFPSDLGSDHQASVSCLGTDLAGSPHPLACSAVQLETVVRYPAPEPSGGAHAGDYYVGSFVTPPRPTPYDQYSPYGAYLSAHLTFPGTGPYAALEPQGANFYLHSLYYPDTGPYGPRWANDVAFPGVTRQLLIGDYESSGGTVTPSTATPTLLGKPSRHYNRAIGVPVPYSSLTQGIVYWRSDAPIPRSESAWDAGPVHVTATIRDNSPSLAMDSRQRLWCAFNRPAQGAMWKVSDDDGQTWGTEVLAIPGGTHPVMLGNADAGWLLCAAVVAIGSPPSVVYHIQGVYRGPGDAAFGSVFVFKDKFGQPLSVANDSFGLGSAGEGPDRIGLHVLIAGDTATSDWWSADVQTWTPIPA